ncbi:hypothetical protein LCGC14_1675100 [marine sediment metagenome]|uniref:SF4 helicase domain-containing protein n=1 Tax=marine sediment metagenome TaxID=412755 RepID=A0A0F9K631_9ZZZZ
MIETYLKIEQQLIYLLLHHKYLVGDWLESRVKKENFNSSHRAILSAIEDSFEQDVLLTRKSFLNIVNKLTSPQMRIKQEISFNECVVSYIDVNDFPLLLSQVLGNYLTRKTTKAIEFYTKNINKLGAEVALHELSSVLDNLNSSATIEGTVIYDDIRSFSAEKIKWVDGVRSGEIKEPPRVLCGISEIDGTMGIGFAEGTLTLFCADTGSFKTTMMLNIAMNVWQSGYNVLFVPVEMADSRMYDKIWAREARVNSEKIADPKKLTDVERQKLVDAQETWEKFESKLYVLQMPKETKVSYIRKEVEKYLSIFKPRLVVIDYIDNLAPDIDRQGRHDLEISDMLQELRRAGQGLGFAVVSGAQLGRDALKRIRASSSSKDQSIIHSEDIRGAHTFSMDSDNIYAQVVNPTQKSLMDIFVVKARYGKRIFPNGKYKATLFVTPEISLIESEENFEIAPGESNLMNKIFEVEESGDGGEVIWDDE